MSLPVESQDEAVLFEVRVAPRASRAACLGAHAGALKIALTAPPVDGAANAALIAFLSKALGVPKRSVGIVRGERAKNKRLRIDTTDPEAVAERLRALAG